MKTGLVNTSVTFSLSFYDPAAESYVVGMVFLPIVKCSLFKIVCAFFPTYCYLTNVLQDFP